MAKKVFNKRMHRKGRVLERRRLKEVSKKSVHEKVMKALNKAKELASPSKK